MSLKYQGLKQEGMSSIELYKEMKRDGLDDIKATFQIRQLFSLSLTEAKAIMIQATSNDTLQSHQDKLADDLEQFIKSQEDELQ